MAFLFRRKDAKVAKGAKDGFSRARIRSVLRRGCVDVGWMRGGRREGEWSDLGGGLVLALVVRAGQGRLRGE